MPSKHLFLSPPGCHEALGDEISRVFPETDRSLISDRWWVIEAASISVESPSLAFSLQTLPNASMIPSVSIRRDADALALHLRGACELIEGPIRLQVFAPLDAQVVSPGKQKLAHASLLESLKKKAKGVLAKIQLETETAETQVAALAQITWVTSGELAVSVTDRRSMNYWRRCISRWPGGFAPVPIDKRPPSRAYRKLVEGLLQFGKPMAAGHSVVDLGASPGGWTFVALDRGAHVLAVDRSPLREDLMAHPRLRFIAGDAFRYRPDAPVDWLIADIAAYPERTFELVRDWLTQKWCRSMIVTVKFVGATNYGILEKFKSMLAHEADDFIIRKLLENKNEVTIMASKDTTSGIRGPTTATDGAT